MNRKIFVTYGDAIYKQSLKRICNEAEQCGEFDEVIAYTEADLPDFIKENPLFTYRRGGGYWLWKPYVCLKTLERCDDGDVVIYSDCGNKIFKHKQWHMYWEWMRKYDAVFFYNGGSMGRWSRKALIDAYTPRVPMLRNMYQIISNFFIFQKGAQHLIEEWLEQMLTHAEYVIDANDAMRPAELPEFIESRHDQAVLSAVAYHHAIDGNILVTRQRSERYSRCGQAVFNARISDNMVRNPMTYEPIHHLLVRELCVVPFRKLKMSAYMMINKWRAKHS